MKTLFVIPTFMRSQDIVRCLKSIDQLSVKSVRSCVIVRDTDVETRAAIAKIQLNHPLQVEIISVPGQVAALNRGLESFEQSDAEQLTILDDDVELPMDWLKTVQALFASRPEISGIGGRDCIPDVTDAPNKPVVGILTFYGKIIGNHHVGAGPFREVDTLKGCNMSFRREAVLGLRFCEILRGKGVQMGNDTEFSLKVKSRGKKIGYDPALVLTHFTSARTVGDERDPYVSSEVLKCNAFNYTLINLRYLPLVCQPLFFMWWLLVGTRGLPGLLQWIRFFFFHAQKISLGHLFTVWKSRLTAYRVHYFGKC